MGTRFVSGWPAIARLICGGSNWELKINAAVVVLFGGRGQVEIGDGNSVAASRRHVVEQGADDGVILYLQLVAIFEYQEGRGPIGNRRRRIDTGW